ncbi:hypothetical protein HAX54_039215, partial [Datura stramonium]|nr:hypothetical protein [Datura stramonium]
MMTLEVTIHWKLDKSLLELSPMDIAYLGHWTLENESLDESLRHLMTRGVTHPKW